MKQGKPFKQTTLDQFIKKKQTTLDQFIKKKQTTLDSLPDELIMEIFSRVPTASVLRSKCVRKSWRSILSRPSFVQLHVQRTTLNPCSHEEDETLVIQKGNINNGSDVIYLLRVVTNVAIPFPFRHLGSNVLIVGTINGIFCLARPFIPFISSLVLYNPVTDQSKILPPPTIVGDDLESDRCWFCYDSVTHDYKVVRAVWFKKVPNIPPRVEVYSLSADRWRAIEAEVPFIPGFSSLTGTIVNGVPFFFAGLEGQRARQIFSFDVGNEVFQPLPPLDLNDLDECVFRIISFKGNWVAVLPHVPSVRSSIAALEDGVTWNRILTNVPSWILGGSRAGILVVEQSKGELVLYRHETQETRGVPITADPAGFLTVHNYTASLVSIL